MATIKFITVGTLKEDYLREAVKEYEKRLSGFCNVEQINLKESKLPNDPSDGEIKRALAFKTLALSPIKYTPANTMVLASNDAATLLK